MRVKTAWLLVCAALAACPAEGALAQYPLSGNVRFQIGHGLPAPLTFAPAPEGKAKAVESATVVQTTGPDPKQLTLAPGMLTAAGSYVTLLVPLPGSKVDHFRSAIASQFPANVAQFRAGGRTGPPTVTWCPGQPLPSVSYNPSCTNPASPAFPTPGLVRYTRTANQFGGVAQSARQGTAIVARNIGSAQPPCHYATNPACIALFLGATPPPLGANGAAFGFSTMRTGAAPKGGVFRVGISAAGRITETTPNGLQPPASDPFTHHGAPWTTGRVTISVRSTLAGGTERFTLTGSDTRVAGVGRVSLVSGAVSVRQLVGPNANRGWLNLTVPEPNTVLSASAMLLVVALCHQLARVRGRDRSR